MSKSLVVVESPAKAKTINKYLGKTFTVMASNGHIKDLPDKGLGVDVEHGFEPTYEVIPDTVKRNNSKTLRELKKAAKEAEIIYLAADPDREGEAICQHLREELAGARSKKPVYRLMFNEITQEAIQKAISVPRQIDSHRVDAQQARRVLDRLVGYQVSPMLCRKVGGKLSAGRVQSVALRLVVERERVIQAFKPTEYWTFAAELKAKLPPQFTSSLHQISGKTLKTGDFDNFKKTEVHIQNETDARAIETELKAVPEWKVASVTTKEKKRYPVPPFITSKLQQEAARKLGFAVKKTMQVAQSLYEGVDLGSEGSVGLITYMRTDSTRVSEGAITEVREFIQAQFGASSLTPQPVRYKTKKDAQDAHEAIRPTSVYRTPESVAKSLGKDELALYKLIWKRFVASQMMPAVFDATTIDIQAGPKFLFRATGSVLRTPGFLAVYEEGKDERDTEDEELALKLPKVEIGEILNCLGVAANQSFTKPLPRFTEATLVKALEEEGIGRPSTYAQILSVILSRAYVEKTEGRFRPTELGMVVNDVLVENFTDLFNINYTAAMEAQLDAIEEGSLNWREALKSFYEKFRVELKSAESNINRAKAGVPTDEKCLKCESPMVLKLGRFGKFLSCTNPECKATRDLETPATESAEPVENPYANETCDTCGKPMALKKGRWGEFLACTGYPECKTTRQIRKSGVVRKPDVLLEELCPQCGKQLARKQGRFGEFVSCSAYPKCKYIKRDTLIACPRKGCKGEIAVKKSKRGKAFYGCTEYPKCEIVYWDRPIPTPCPKCKAAFLLEKTTKKEGTILYCADKEGCGYVAPATAGAESPGTEPSLQATT
ncbi:MAG TPA: type I DNA topoisomerase [Acidobacteriota bacterium]|nr:type I DNA topoisomerase [Acidobacteriota bacterium]HNB70276.1 type I DNA topoisomerase [Acidobacteriota bacterium]HND18662.1 type I DNA topoisomerase [Acidobacteriota bacterium]HNG91803.1 type I DNA topoisomerase [Acidobacteriota bacterium]HNH80858.1 type I DNA topoisomerase [Acidobacteriota bacterium]